jgi:glycosyltransferase involved in cell wall biosynthesis
MTFPKVSVVATVKNEEDSIAALLDSISKLDYAGEIETIIVDGGSTDSTAQIVSKYTSAKLVIAYCNISEGRNIGISKSTGEIIAFVDGDCIAAPDWITNIVRHFREDSEIAIVGGPYIPSENQGIVAEYLAVYQNSYFPKTSGITTYEHIAMGNAAIRKEIITKVGGFDPGADQFEDEDINFRSWKLGLKLFFADDVRVLHKYRTSLKDASAVILKRSEANFNFNKKHKRYIKILFPYTRSLILASLAVLLLSLVFGNLTLFASELVVLILCFYFYSYIRMRKNTRSPNMALRTKLLLPMIDLYVRLLDSLSSILWPLHRLFKPT